MRQQTKYIECMKICQNRTPPLNFMHIECMKICQNRTPPLNFMHIEFENQFDIVNGLSNNYKV
jgi:hypothetical protein